MLQRPDIEKYFRKFLDEPVPEIMKGYGTDHNRIIAKVFTVILESKTMVDPSNPNKKLTDEYTWPIARVYNVGDAWDGPKLKVGDLVRLNDETGLKQYNQRYEVMINNPYSKSNIKDNQVNPLPPKYIMNLWVALGRKTFSPDPLELDSASWKVDVFYLDSGNVVCPIVDPEKFFIIKKPA